MHITFPALSLLQAVVVVHKQLMHLLRPSLITLLCTFTGAFIMTLIEFAGLFTVNVCAFCRTSGIVRLLGEFELPLILFNGRGDLFAA